MFYIRCKYLNFHTHQGGFGLHRILPERSRELAFPLNKIGETEHLTQEQIYEKKN
jgi:hypothetical protein